MTNKENHGEALLEAIDEVPDNRDRITLRRHAEALIHENEQLHQNQGHSNGTATTATAHDELTPIDDLRRLETCIEDARQAVLHGEPEKAEDALRTAAHFADMIREEWRPPRKPLSPEQRVLIDGVLHPTGRCTCCGEGTCAWCLDVTKREAEAPAPGGHGAALGAALLGIIYGRGTLRPDDGALITACRHAEALIHENTRLMQWAANRGHEKGCPWFCWEWSLPKKPCTCGLGGILDGSSETKVIAPDEDCPRCIHKHRGEGDEPCFTCSMIYGDTLKHPRFTPAKEAQEVPTEQQKRTTVTREAPTRGSVKDYQDWLVEQLRAGVDGHSTGADINDLAWAGRVVRAEEQRDRARGWIHEERYSLGDDRYEIELKRAALADDPPTKQEKTR